MLIPVELLVAAEAVPEPTQTDLNWIVIAGFIQPFVTQILTKSGASAGVSRIVNFVLSALVGAANAVYEDQQHGGPFDWKRAMLVSAGVWLTSATAYVHLLKDTPPMKKVEAATGNVGFGTVPPNPPDSVPQDPHPDQNLPNQRTMVVPAPEVGISEAHAGPDPNFEWTWTAKPVSPPQAPPSAR